MLKNIQNRGVEQILLFVSDGLRGLTQTCLSVYPQARYQPCWVHIQRNVLRLVRSGDKAEIASKLKVVYQSSTQQEADLHLKKFVDDLY